MTSLIIFTTLMSQNTPSTVSTNSDRKGLNLLKIQNKHHDTFYSCVYVTAYTAVVCM
jgi:hypothetical protein